jgi:hypothetical protein
LTKARSGLYIKVLWGNCFKEIFMKTLGQKLEGLKKERYERTWPIESQMEGTQKLFERAAAVTPRGLSLAKMRAAFPDRTVELVGTPHTLMGIDNELKFTSEKMPLGPNDYAIRVTKEGNIGKYETRFFQILSRSTPLDEQAYTSGKDVPVNDDMPLDFSLAFDKNSLGQFNTNAEPGYFRASAEWDALIGSPHPADINEVDAKYNEMNDYEKANNALVAAIMETAVKREAGLPVAEASRVFKKATVFRLPGQAPIKPHVQKPDAERS